MLSNRPLVISDNDAIDIKLLTENEEVVLTLDGQVGIPIKFNDIIRIEKSDTRVDLIELPGSNFFNILRRKLNWGPTNHNS
jgi:NAD+ kinase